MTLPRNSSILQSPLRHPRNSSYRHTPYSTGERSPLEGPKFWVSRMDCGHHQQYKNFQYSYPGPYVFLKSVTQLHDETLKDAWKRCQSWDSLAGPSGVLSAAHYWDYFCAVPHFKTSRPSVSRLKEVLLTSTHITRIIGHYVGAPGSGKTRETMRDCPQIRLIYSAIQISLHFSPVWLQVNIFIIYRSDSSTVLKIDTDPLPFPPPLPHPMFQVITFYHYNDLI